MFWITLNNDSIDT